MLKGRPEDMADLSWLYTLTKCKKNRKLQPVLRREQTSHMQRTNIFSDIQIYHQSYGN